ncbi:unannotated protein [freshwater metagenome]|uniref:Unannotated protein n=1 Tax=freshwater metagenome TaxID=449393 RepID=A0A6J7GZG4_9ZZZZ
MGDLRDRQAAEVRRGVEVADLRLERVLGVERRRGDRLEDAVEQLGEVLAQLVRADAGAAVAADRVVDGELELVVLGVELEEELLDVRDDLLDLRVGAIDLVDDEDDRQVGLERLAEHEARLGQRALRRVDEEDDAVDEGQAALDLAAEVGVAGRVDDRDRRVAPLDDRVLGEDGDPALALLVVRVHDAVGVLAAVQGAGLTQHRVDEGGLPVVDVGDDGDGSEVCTCGRHSRRRIGTFDARPPGGRLRVLTRAQHAGR